MVKTQIQIEEWQYDALKGRCARESRSMSDFIRESLSQALKHGRSTVALSELAGKYAPNSADDDLKSHDAGWVQSIR
jgi:plasmid stability protein